MASEPQHPPPQDGQGEVLVHDDNPDVRDRPGYAPAPSMDPEGEISPPLMSIQHDEPDTNVVSRV